MTSTQPDTQPESEQVPIANPNDQSVAQLQSTELAQKTDVESLTSDVGGERSQSVVQLQSTDLAQKSGVSAVGKRSVPEDSSHLNPQHSSKKLYVAPEKPLVVPAPPYWIDFAQWEDPEVMKFLVAGTVLRVPNIFPLAIIVFDYAGYNKKFGNSKYPAIMPKFKNKFIGNFPWMKTSFDFGPHMGKPSSNWETYIRVVGGDFPDTDAKYLKALSALHARLCDIIFENKEKWDLVPDVEILRDVEKGLTQFVKPPRKDGFENYQKLRVDIRRDKIDRTTKPEQHDFVNLSMFDNRTLVDSKPRKVTNFADLKKNMAIKGTWELVHVAIQDKNKYVATTAAREVKIDEMENIKIESGVSIVECSQ